MLKLHQFLHFFITLNFLKLVRIEKATHPAIRMCGEFMVFYNHKNKTGAEIKKNPREIGGFSHAAPLSV